MTVELTNNKKKILNKELEKAEGKDFLEKVLQYRNSDIYRLPLPNQTVLGKPFGCQRQKIALYENRESMPSGKDTAFRTIETVVHHLQVRERAIYVAKRLKISMEQVCKVYYDKFIDVPIEERPQLNIKNYKSWI